MAKVVVPVLHLDHHGWTGGIDQAQRSQHRRQNRTRVVAGLAHQRLRTRPAQLRGVTAATTRTGIAVPCRSKDTAECSTSKGNDFFRRKRTTASASGCFSGRVSKSRSMTRVVASGMTRQMSRARPATAASRVAQSAAPACARSDDVRLLQPGSKQSLGQCRRRRRFQVSSAFGCARRDNTFSADFAGDAGAGYGVVVVKYSFQLSAVS